MAIHPKPWIYNLPEYIPGRTLEEIKKEYKLDVVYKLASNENIFGPCPEVIEYIKNNAGDINYYPDSDCRDVKKSLSLKYKIPIDNIIVGNGTDQIIEMVCDCFIDTEDNAAVCDPTFLIYEKSTLKCGGKVIKVPLVNFRQDVNSIIDSVDNKTRIVFLTNPHNPTGTNIRSGEFDYVINNIAEDVMVVVDEAYYEYIPDGEKIDTINYLNEHKNIIILRTFSKIYGLAGLRIGYGISGREVISILNKIRLPFNVNLIGQKAAVVALKNEQYVKDICKKVQNERNKFFNFFGENDIEFIKTYANFILIKTGKMTKQIVEELLKSGFIVRPGDNLGVPEYIRVTISVPEINDKFLMVFNKIYKKHYR